jgi:hypothetical protein
MLVQKNGSNKLWFWSGDGYDCGATPAPQGGLWSGEIGVAPPIMAADAATNDTTPTWAWSSGGDGDGTYRYQLNAKTDGEWTTTTATSWTTPTPLADGAYVLYVQERDAQGDWSAATGRTVTVDSTMPNAPVVTSAAALATNATPTWTWTPGGGGAGTFRYQLNATDDDGWTTVTATSYTPATALANGTYTLYVQERNDESGSWSAPGSYAVTVDTTPPAAPVVTSATVLTDNPTPTWSWTSGGGGNGMFRYQLDSTDPNGWTINPATSYTPLTALADGTHVLYVKELDDAGHMSPAGSYAVTVDTTPPAAPTVTAALVTARRSAWTWTSGGGGNGTFQYQLDSTGGAWTPTTATRFVSTEDLALGAHVLYVRERDDAGNWSAIGSCSIAAINAAHAWQGYR